MAFQKTALVIALSGVLIGCGGGDSDQVELDASATAPIPQPEVAPRLFSNGDLSAEASLGAEVPVGVYRYTVSDPLTGDSIVGLGLISHSGRIAFALPEDLSFARIQLGENNRFEDLLESTESPADAIRRVVTGGRDKAAPADSLATIAGSVLDRDTNDLLINYRLEKQAPDELNLTLADLAATYSDISESGVGTALNIAADGTLSGSDTTGCDFSGRVIIPSTSEDVFEASFEAENCGPTPGITGVDRDGDWFAVGRANLDAGTITVYATNGSVGTRLSATDNASGDNSEGDESNAYYSNDFNEEPSVSGKLEAGVYAYTDIPVNDNPPVIESGTLFVSDTGRIAVVTDRRFGVARIELNDVDTFTAEFDQVERPGADQSPTEAVSIFGTPDNNGTGNPFKIAGSLLDRNDDLENRYSAERDESNDAAFAADPLTLTNLSGTFSGTRDPGAITTTLTFATDGTVNGSDNTGCVFNGSANIPDGQAGVLEVRLNVANCSASTTRTGAERNGNYNGVGDLQPGSPDQLRLVMATPGDPETPDSQPNIELVTLDRQ